jgi:S1-C subfamily serine protease
VKQLLLALLLTALASLSLSCKCHRDHTVRVIHETPQEEVISVDDIEVPLSKADLIEYNVTISNRERPNCGGTVIKSDDTETLILTAAHCIWDELKDPMTYGYVDFNNDDKYRVEVVDYSRNQDLALLRVTDKIDLKLAAKLADSPPVAGDPIWVLGYGARIDDIMSDGIISKAKTTSRHTPRTNCVIIDASAYYGNSGGGVYNEDDELVGVLIQNGPQHPTEGIWNYAVHLDEIKKFLEPYME